MREVASAHAGLDHTERYTLPISAAGFICHGLEISQRWQARRMELLAAARTRLTAAEALVEEARVVSAPPVDPLAVRREIDRAALFEAAALRLAA